MAIMKYYVKFGTGAGDLEIEGTLEEAKKITEERLTYTQKLVKIENEDGEEVSFLPWCSEAPDEDEIVTAQFGDWGFYSEWHDMW